MPDAPNPELPPLEKCPKCGQLRCVCAEIEATWQADQERWNKRYNSSTGRRRRVIEALKSIDDAYPVLAEVAAAANDRVAQERRRKSLEGVDAYLATLKPPEDRVKITYRRKA